MNYEIISINEQERTAIINYKGNEAKIIFHHGGEVDVESETMELEDVQDVHMMACEDETFNEVFPCED